MAFVVGGVPQSLHSRKEGEAGEVAGKRQEFQKGSFHDVEYCASTINPSVA